MNIKSSIFSNKSNEIIAAVIEIVKPDRVMIESCGERRELMYLKPTGKFSWHNFFTAPTLEMENYHNDLLLYCIGYTLRNSMDLDPGYFLYYM